MCALWCRGISVLFCLALLLTVKFSWLFGSGWAVREDGYG